MGLKKLAALAVVAHPDDAELSMGGTLARLRKSGYETYVAVLTDGSRGIGAGQDSVSRTQEVEAAAAILGYTPIFLGFEDAELQIEAELISAIDRHVELIQPQIVITHCNEYKSDHTDHLVTGRATVNSASRKGCPMIWLAEAPTPKSEGFAPNEFIDISDFLESKLKAVAAHKTQNAKWYMKREIIESRAREWPIKAFQAGYQPGRFCEAYQIFKSAMKM